MALEFPGSPTDGEIYGNYQWNDTDGVWELLPSPTQALDDLADVDLTTPSSGEALVYDGTNWVNGGSTGGFARSFLTMGA